MPTATPADLEPLFRELSRRDDITAGERRALLVAVDEIRVIPARTIMVRQGERPTHSTLLLSGMAIRFVELPDGKRQIAAIHVSGDFVDLHSFPLKIMDHSVATVQASRVARVPHGALEKITREEPHLTRMLWLMTMIDSARHRSWITGMGALSAVERTAHLLCELAMRMSEDGVHPAASIRLPITQAEFADTLGLSQVHTNRVIQALRARSLIQWEGDLVRILDGAALQELGQFDPAFLHLEKLPR
jgi:CRP-like cAMP-binding protein